MLIHKLIFQRKSRRHALDNTVDCVYQEKLKLSNLLCDILRNTVAVTYIEIRQGKRSEYLGIESLSEPTCGTTSRLG